MSEAAFRKWSGRNVLPQSRESRRGQGSGDRRQGGGTGVRRRETGVRGRDVVRGVEESLAGGLDDASEQGPATAGGQAGHAKSLAGMNHGAVGIELEGWGEVGGEHGGKRGAESRSEIGDRRSGQGQGTGVRGQGSGSEYMYRMERNLGNIGTLGRKSLWARRKKFLWSQSALFGRVVERDGFLHLHFPAVQNLGRGASAEMVLGDVFTGLVWAVTLYRSIGGRCEIPSGGWWH